MHSELMAQLSTEMGQQIRSTIAAQLQPISKQLSQRGGPSVSGQPSSSGFLEINLDTDLVLLAAMVLVQDRSEVLSLT